MFSGLHRIALLALGLCGICAVTAAGAVGDEYWPAWRGPLASGVSPTAKPPATWSETSNIKWKVKIPGQGTGSPVVWENRVFLLTAIAKSSTTAQGGNGMTTPPPAEPLQFAVQCLDRQTGKLLWQQIAREEVPHEGHHPDGTYAAASAVTDGERVYAFFGSRGLYCFDMEGKLQWKQDFGKMKILMGFGEGCSPALYGDALIVNWDHEDGSFIVALNKKTGDTLWKQTRDEKTSWATPLVVEYEGKPQVVTAATSKIRSYDLATGNQIWECTGLTRNVIPSPVTANGIVYCISGYSGNSLLAIQLGKTGNLTGTDAVVWKYAKNTPYVPSPLLYGEKLYFLSNNNGVLSCFDAKTGKPLIDAAKIDALPNVYASPVGADGKIYLLGRNGAAVVIKQSDKLEILATNQLDEKFECSPALVGKEIFLRGREYLYCIAEK